MEKVSWGNVKALQGVGQFFGGQVAQKVVEHAEGIADFSGVLDIFDGVKGLRTVDKADGAPERVTWVEPVVLPVLCQQHAHHFPATARAEGGTLQTLANMLGEGAHVEHDKFRLTKHLGVEALQDEMLFRFGIQGYQEGVIDIAIPIFMDVNDRAL